MRLLTKAPRWLGVLVGSRDEKVYVLLVLVPVPVPVTGAALLVLVPVKGVDLSFLFLLVGDYIHT